MKQTHLRNGEPHTIWLGGGRKVKSSIPTLCGAGARSEAKATTNVFKVTCSNCQGKLFGRRPTADEWFEYLKAHRSGL